MAVTLLISPTGCTQRPGQPTQAGADRGASPPAQPVGVTEAALGSIEHLATISGLAEAREKVTIASKVPGRVAAVAAAVGDRVGKDQALIRLDAAEAEAQLEQALAAEATASADAERMATLYEEGAIPRQQWEQVKLRLTQARVGVDLARSQLANASITTPIAGIVTARHVNPGEMASPGVPLLTVMDSDLIYVTGNLAENQVALVKPGQEAQVTFDAFPGRSYPARVRRVNPAADARTRSFPVEVEVPNKDGGILPGMFAKLTIPLQRRDNVVTVPQEAVLLRGNRTLVYVVEKGVARARPVETGISDGAHTEITAGLRSGEQVIVSGQHYVGDGTPVSVQQPAGTSGGGTSGGGS